MLFPNIQTNSDLAKSLGNLSASYLTYLSFNTYSNYKKYKIPKKRPGEFREIFDPSKALRRVQYKLLKNIWEKYPVLPECYAFETGKSIPQMVQHHVGKRVVLSFDIKNFFPSIRVQNLYDVLISEGMGVAPAKTVSELCTYTYFVPQGALTSPKVSNIIATLSFGPEIVEYCKAKGLTVTIYADDITISGDTIPNIEEVKMFVATTLQKYGFYINTKKTKIMTRKTRQWVCGVVVNEKSNLLVKERKRLRAIVHNVSRNGLEAEASKNNKSPEEFRREITGRLNWFKQLNAAHGQRLWDTWQSTLSTGTTHEETQIQPIEAVVTG